MLVFRLLRTLARPLGRVSSYGVPATVEEVLRAAEKHVSYSAWYIGYSNSIGSELSVLSSHLEKIADSGHPLVAAIEGQVSKEPGPSFPVGLLTLLLAKSIPPSKCHASFNQDCSKQRALAEIVDTISTAFLAHDSAVTLLGRGHGKRGKLIHSGNKLSVLSGDLLLARVSVALAEMELIPVLELVSMLIRDLGEGYAWADTFPVLSSREAWDQFCYLRYGTVYANSFKSSLFILGCNAEMQNNAFDLGIAVGHLAGIHSLLTQLVRSGDNPKGLESSLVWLNQNTGAPLSCEAAKEILLEIQQQVMDEVVSALESLPESTSLNLFRTVLSSCRR